VPEVVTTATGRQRSSAPALQAMAAALVIAAAAFFYRFNALGGALGGFGNDQFIQLARARQMLAGELPFRDFSDPGAPLTSGVSALFQWLFGYNLFAEAILTAGALALGAAMTLWLSARVTGRLWPAVLVTVLQVAIGPRLYNYPKIVVTALAIWVCWRYVDWPSFARLAAVAIVLVVGFLFRHDYLVYLAVLDVATIALVHRGGLLGWKRIAALAVMALVLVSPFLLFLQLSGGVVEYARQAAAFARADSSRTRFEFPVFQLSSAGPLISLGAPPPAPPARINVRWSTDVDDSVRGALERQHGLTKGEPREGTTWSYEIRDTSRANIQALVRDPRVLDTHGLDRTRFELQARAPERGWRAAVRNVRLSPALTDAANAVAWLYYFLVLLPGIAILSWAVRRRSSRYDSARLHAVAPFVWPVALMMALLAVAFLSRGTTSVRLADVAVPAGILGAWVLCPARERRPLPPSASLTAWLRRLAAVAVVGVTAYAAGIVGTVSAVADRSGFTRNFPAVLQRAEAVSDMLHETPPIRSLMTAPTPFARVAAYVDRCSPPASRLLVAGNMPEMYFFSGRLMAGGHVWFVPGYGTDPAAQNQTLARLRAHDVPLVISESALYQSHFAGEFPLIDRHIRDSYRRIGTLPIGEGTGVDLWLSRSAAWTGTDRETGLPCSRVPR
jgi:hypothetical protein